MNVDLSEEEMRRALFGTSEISAPQKSEPRPLPEQPRPVARKPTGGSTRSSKLRVTLRVTKVYEGEEEIFTFDASTLSSLVAEQEARNAAKKKRFKYIQLISITSI